MHVQNTYRPVITSRFKVFPTEVKEGNLVFHCCLHISYQCQGMGDSHLRGVIRVNATSFETASSLDDPEMFSQLAAIEVSPKLLRPKCEKSGKAIDATIWIAIMPAINQP